MRAFSFGRPQSCDPGRPPPHRRRRGWLVSSAASCIHHRAPTRSSRHPGAAVMSDQLSTREIETILALSVLARFAASPMRSADAVDACNEVFGVFRDASSIREGSESASALWEAAEEKVMGAFYEERVARSVRGANDPSEDDMFIVAQDPTEILRAVRTTIYRRRNQCSHSWASSLRSSRVYAPVPHACEK